MRFKPSAREQLISRNAAFKFLGMDSFVQEVRPKRTATARERSAENGPESLGGVPPAAVAPLEAEVLRAVSDLLAAHPRVLIAIRQNSGQASYEAKSGKWAPVAFYKWVKRPETMTLPDYWGMLDEEYTHLRRMFFLEVKRPSWTKPTDDRERAQAAFLRLMRDSGHIAAFITDARQVEEMLR